MRDLKYTTSKGMSLVLVAVFVLRAMTALAQSATENCRPASVIPLTNKEPPARIVVDPPLAEPLAQRKRRADDEQHIEATARSKAAPEHGLGGHRVNGTPAVVVHS